MTETSSQPVERPPTPRALKVLRLLAFLIVPAVFVGFLWAGLASSQRPQDLVGQRGPTFELPLVADGGSISNRDLQGRPVVVNFWASWCTPCREEAALFEQKWQKYRDRVVFLGVNVQDSKSDAAAFVKEFGITYPVVRDVDQVLYRDMAVGGLPETFFLDRRWIYVGVGAGEQISSRGSTKVRGAIQATVLESQIKLMLEEDD